MKWVGISGSWRRSTPELEADVQRQVHDLLKAGDGIVTGGALGVDYAATALALAFAPDGSHLQVFLPTTLEIYAAYFRNRADESVITRDQAESLISQLETVDKLGKLHANAVETEVNPRTYYLRNSEVLKASDKLLAFQVNKSPGTQDTIDKAKQLGMPVRVFSYQVG